MVEKKSDSGSVEHKSTKGVESSASWPKPASGILSTSEIEKSNQVQDVKVNTDLISKTREVEFLKNKLQALIDKTKDEKFCADGDRKYKLYQEISELLERLI